MSFITANGLAMLALPTFWLIVLTYWPPGISELRPTRLDPPPPLEFSYKLLHFQTRARFPTRASRNACFLIGVDAVNVTHYVILAAAMRRDSRHFEFWWCINLVDIYLNENFWSWRTVIMWGFLFCQFHFDVVIEFISWNFERRFQVIFCQRKKKLLRTYSILLLCIRISINSVRVFGFWINFLARSFSDYYIT